MSSTVLLLPGLMCDSTIWSNQLQRDALGPAIVADFGAARTLTEMAACALATAPPTFSLAGHSMGARVALEVFRLAPKRVARLALLNTGVHPVRPGEAEKRHALLAIGRTRGMDALVDNWLPPMVHPARRFDEAIMQPLRDMCLRAGLVTCERQIEALLTRPDPRVLLPTITCPTLVATGREDVWSPVKQHEEIAGAIPSAELIVFENSGHMAPFEQPAEVNAALLRWLGTSASARNALA